MVFNTRRRAAAKEVEKLWLPKFASRLVCIFFAIVAIGLAGATFKWDSGVIWLVVPLGLSIIWNTANVIVRSVRARPIHPGANVGCDLVIWIIFTVAISLSFIAATVTTNYYPYSYDNYAPVKGHNGSVSYNPTKCNGFDTCKELDDFVGFVHRIGKLQIAAGVFSTICLILHLTFFVWACIDTAHRNRTKYDTRATEIAARMVDDMEQKGLIVRTSHQQEHNPQPKEDVSQRPNGLITNNIHRHGERSAALSPH